MNDSLRNSVSSSRSSTYAQRGSLVDDLSSVQGQRGSVELDGTASARHSMVSVRSTMPPAPGAPGASGLTSSAQTTSTAAEPAEPLVGVDSQRIKDGLSAADKVGVKTAQLGFWGKLAGTVVTGLGMVAFGLVTGGVGPLAIAGLALTGAYFLKSCGDVHLARRELQNARAVQAGQAPPHELPCGTDSVAHLLYRPIRSLSMRGIDKQDPQAVARAEQTAQKWAKGVGLCVDLGLGVSAVVVTSAVDHRVVEGLAFLGVRMVANYLSSLLSSTPPEKFQQDSIDLARRDLAFVEGQLFALRVDEPQSFNDPHAMYRYQDQTTQLDALRSRFIQVKDRFETQLRRYEQGLNRLDPTQKAGILEGLAEFNGAGSETVDMGITTFGSGEDGVAVISALGLTAVQSMRSVKQLSRQKGLEEHLTQAFLSMNQDLKILSNEALTFKAVLGMEPLAS